MATQAQAPAGRNTARIWQLISLLLFAMNVALVAGILTQVGDMGLPASFIAGASAFGSTVLVGTALWTVFGRD